MSVDTDLETDTRPRADTDLDPTTPTSTSTSPPSRCGRATRAGSSTASATRSSRCSSSASSAPAPTRATGACWSSTSGCIRGRLNDLFLDLLVDRSREVAWKRQATSETGGRFPTLLHDVAWSREETLVLVHLRDRLRAGLAGGDARVYVDRDDVVDYVESFRPAHATDEAGDEKRARNAVTSIVKAGLLIGAPGDDRFEISEAVEPLLPLELLQELLEALRRANGGDAPDEPEGDLFDAGRATSSGQEQA